MKEKEDEQVTAGDGLSKENIETFEKMNKEGIGVTDESLASLMEANRELDNKYVRLYAEFENHKRRFRTQLSDTKSQTKYSTVKELLDIMDDIHLSRAALGEAEDAKDWIDGASLIFDKLDSYISSVGIQEEICESGTRFDPDSHDCVTVIDMGEDNTGKIIEVIKRGYSIDGKIVKYPKVVVGK
jgi:molecular chaperone GrpE